LFYLLKTLNLSTMDRNGGFMTHIRVRMPDDIWIKFQVLCIEQKISVPKQVTELIRKFVEIQEQNKKLIGK